MATQDELIREQVRAYYGEFLTGSDDLRTDACCCSTAAPPKYVIDALESISDEIIAHFYGCGSPIPPALEGMTVLDLGCGTGRDVYIASKLVGPSGHVIGVDMTPSQLDFARSFEEEQMHAFGYERSNVEFIESYIEDMAQIADESIDVVISNCVVNLSPFKPQLFKEIFRVLKPGGELYFSDIFSDRRVPEGFYDDPILRGECLSGALYIEDFRRILADCGVSGFYDVTSEELHIGDFRIATKLGCIGFSSHTMRAIKSADLEDREEDYGQTATYLGTMPENRRYFDLSDEVRLIKGRPVAISGNMATTLSQSRYAGHFEISPRGEHVGVYDYERAQEALALARGRSEVDLAHLQEACGRLGIAPFAERLHDPDLLLTSKLATMQVNVGYACNLACSHCYLECSPASKELMSRETMDSVIAAFKTGGFPTLDITGGSPEMNPNLEWLIEQARPIADEIIVRSNLTILDMPGYERFIDIYVKNRVKIVCSLPYFTEEGCDSQRGGGVFERIMRVMRRLNDRGYGREDDLQIDLVYNVDGPFLPPNQEELNDLYTYELRKSEGIDFNGLYAFNNYNLGRFAKKLKAQRKFDYYLELLSENYNAAVVAHIMCRTQINVDWDGRLYDCECNHVLGLPINGPAHISDIAVEPLERRRIVTSPICYSCAAGSGSSCGGSLLQKAIQEEAAFQ
ncbi:MAG: arsenosugar biosynthesis radical SAM protein ArsS [bacterium]|nr:arsenosugar biosynthesis radical SAM protein ArsS [bacterium]